ncbi:MAG: oligosaccharide flippase family protein [Alphaproteobacteria bacterium]|nr:oligosaccharide flippase family protein [Alphaproteobacteria bacterium]
MPLPAAVAQPLLFAGGLIATRALSLVLLPVYARYLGPEGYGQLETVVVLADLASILAGSGLAATLFRFAGTAEAERRALGLALMVAGAALILGQISAPLLAPLVPGGADVLSVRLVLATVALEAVIQVPLGWLRLANRPVGYLMAGVVRAVMQAGLTLGFLAHGYGVVGVLAAGTLGAAGQALWLVIWQWRVGGSAVFDRGSRVMIAWAGPAVLSGLAGFALCSADRWILVGASDTETLGYWAMAARFALVVPLILQPWQAWWLPQRFRLAETAPARARRLTWVGIGLAGLATLVVMLGGPVAIALLLPPSFAPAAALVPGLAAIACLKAIGDQLDIHCLSRRHGSARAALATGIAGLAVLLLGPLAAAQGPHSLILLLLGAWCLRLALLLLFGWERWSVFQPGTSSTR